MRQELCPMCGWGTVGMALWWVLGLALLAAILWLAWRASRRR